MRKKRRCVPFQCHGPRSYDSKPLSLAWQRIHKV